VGNELLLLTATEAEGQSVLERAEELERTGGASARGRLAGVRFRWIAAGLGPVNTALGLTRDLEGVLPTAVIQLGIGGGFIPAGLAPGDVVVATEEIYGDLGVITPTGWHGAEMIGIPLVPGDPPRFNRFPLEPELTRAAAAACSARFGPFLTQSLCTGSARVAGELWGRWGALCENMEGAAAAHVCTVYQVPFVEIRGISNLVEDRNRESWQIGRAIGAATGALLEVVRDLHREGYW
jgi:futalosine hydrolase